VELCPNRGARMILARKLRISSRERGFNRGAESHFSMVSGSDWLGPRLLRKTMAEIQNYLLTALRQ